MKPTKNNDILFIKKRTETESSKVLSPVLWKSKGYTKYKQMRIFAVVNTYSYLFYRKTQAVNNNPTLSQLNLSYNPILTLVFHICDTA